MKITEVKKCANTNIEGILDKLPKDEVFCPAEIKEITGCSIGQIKRLSFKLRDNSAKMLRVTYWGSKVAIKNLKKHLEIK